MTTRLNAQELRDLDNPEVTEKLKAIKRRPIYFILENIYDTYNIGGLFRLADALAIEKMYLCGEMEIPPNHRIAKASIGTYKIVPWEYKKTAQAAIEMLRSTVSLFHGSIVNNEALGQCNNLRVIAVEQDKLAQPYTEVAYSLPIAFVFGNETFGVTQETLVLCDKIVEIPMWGINKSLNVIVSAAIVSYFALSKI